MTEAPIIAAIGLKKYFHVRSWVGREAIVRAVDGVDLEMFEGETLGLVGESGSGKSTTGRLILNLEPATQGQVLYEGRNLAEMGNSQMRRLRRDLQIVFQDPYSSLNGRMRVHDILAEPFLIHREATGDGLAKRVDALLNMVGLPVTARGKFPHEFSGGQRQRIAIARAIALSPRFVVCDEPVSALDVSVQSQIINLLRALQRELNLTYLFISHDLSVVRYVSTRIAVMYLGRVVELGPRDDVLSAPLHPYTQSLLSAVPVPHPRLQRKRQRILLKGDIPNPVNQPSGCPFHTRCPFAAEVCATETPAWRQIRPNHWAACHFAPLSSTANAGL